MSRISRESFLQVGAGAAALALAAAPAGAQVIAPGRLKDIDHFIILMQENRSFDHYFGTLRGVRGFDDANALPNVFRQPDHLHPDGHVLPFRLDTARTSAQKLHDLNHDWGPQHESLNG